VTTEATREFYITPATERDVPAILTLIRGLADYERLGHEVTATEADLREALFGARPAAEAILGVAGGRPVGFAVFFQNFSTFTGRPGLYLEDLFVLPEWRNRGLGRELLAYLAAVALSRNYTRMEWSVLDWNEPARRVYRRAGARAMDEWTVHRLAGPALAALAHQHGPPIAPAPRPATRAAPGAGERSDS
jgi:GNAT superfamily N-acetyltransferase